MSPAGALPAEIPVTICDWAEPRRSVPARLWGGAHLGARPSSTERVIRTVFPVSSARRELKWKKEALYPLAVVPLCESTCCTLISSGRGRSLDSALQAPSTPCPWSLAAYEFGHVVDMCKGRSGSDYLHSGRHKLLMIRSAISERFAAVISVARLYLPRRTSEERMVPVFPE